MKIGNITPTKIYSKGNYIKSVYVGDKIIWSTDPILMGGIVYNNNLYTSTDTSWPLNENNGTSVAAFCIKSSAGNISFGNITWVRAPYNFTTSANEATVGSISLSFKSSNTFVSGSSPFTQMAKGTVISPNGLSTVSGLIVGKKYKFQFVISSSTTTTIGKKMQIEFIQGVKNESNSNIYQYSFGVANYLVIDFTFICDNSTVIFKPLEYNDNETVAGTLFGALNILQDVV
jgi:hypothetical protein